MHAFAAKAIRSLVLAAGAVTLLTCSAMAADQAIGVGATTGSALRLRAEASSDSSIVTLLEKGVAVAILDDSDEDWFRVAYNGKTGYVSADYLVVDQDNEFDTYGRVNASGVNVRDFATIDGDVMTVVDEGKVLDVIGFENGWYAVMLDNGEVGYVRSDFLNLTASKTAVSESGNSIVDMARQYLGVRYVYGGASPSGFDCSGFTMYLYGKQGVSLPHSATSQWQSGAGTRVYSVGELQPGDLVFFCDPSRSLGKACSHTGIYIGGGQIIHASSSRSGGVITSDLTSGYYNRYFVGGMHIG